MPWAGKGSGASAKAEGLKESRMPSANFLSFTRIELGRVLAPRTDVPAHARCAGL